MYNLVDYGSMLCDHVRVEAFRKALAETVPGKRVLEIGGGTGFFACLASTLGAAHVTSIETNKLILEGARLAQANGLSNIEFVHGSSRHFQAKEPYDLILHDLRGNTPFFEKSMATLRDASRFLKSGGVFLPRRDRVFAALVEDEDFYSGMEGVWSTHLAGLDLTSLRSGTHRRLRYQPSTAGKHWPAHLIADIEYAHPSIDSVESSVTFVPEHGGTSHGVALWFDTELTDHIGYTTNPWADNDERGTTYGVAILPWSHPVDIQEGKEYQLTTRLDQQGNGSVRLSTQIGGSRMVLGAFSEKPGLSSGAQLPTDYRFAPHSLVKAYRIGLQSMERGQRVTTAVERIRESCDDIPSDEAAYRVLTRCVDLTQVKAKRGREYVANLSWNGSHVRLIANSAPLLSDARERLSPSWKTKKARSRSSLEIRIQDLYTSQGRGCSLSVSEKSLPFHSREEALEQLEALVLWKAVLGSGNYVCLETDYIVEGDAAKLSLSTHAKQPCLLNFKHQVVPYATSGKDLPTTRALRVVGTQQHKGVSRGLLVALLLQRCQNPDVLGEPTAYFAKLAELVRS